MKKRDKILLGILAGIFIILFVSPIICIIIGVYQSSFDVDKIATYESPNGQYQLKLNKIGEPIFTKESYNIRFTLKKDSKTLKKLVFHIEDGTLSSSCCSPIWYEDRVEIFVCEEFAAFKSNPIIIYFEE